MNNMRIIKLITPNNEMFSIEISGNEVELKELISILAGVPPNDIKGIKDKYGNYYTLSFAVNNYIINSEFSESYYLICANRERLYNNHFRLKSGQHNSHINNVYNDIDNDDDLSFNINKNVRNTKSRTHSSLFSPSRITNVGSNFIDKCLYIIKDLHDKDKLDDKNIPKIKQMILSENEDIMNLFKIYIQEIIDKKTFILSLNKIVANFFDSSRPHSPTLQKNKILKLVDQLENSIFDDQNDILLLKNLIEFDNEFVLGAFEVYESDGDLENLIDSIKRLIKRYKRNNNNNYNSNENKNTSKKTLSDLRKPSITDSQIKPKPAYPFSKDIEKYIISNLHTEQKIIFKYSLTNKLPEIEILINYYETLGRTDLLLKSIKVFTKKFFTENLIKTLNETQKNKFEELLVNRNTNLINLFKSFNDHYSITQLEREICSFIKGLEKNILDSSGSDVENSINKDSSRINEFMKVISGLFKKNEKNQIEKMIEMRVPQVISLIDNFFKNKNTNELKKRLTQLIEKNNESIMDHKSILNKLEKSKNDISIMTENSPVKTSIQIYTSFEKLLFDLEKGEKISQNQHKYVIQRYKNNDDIILSAWEIYTHNHNLDDLIESIKIFSSNRKINTQILNKTPLGFAKSKNEIIDFLKSKESKEKEEIKKKQLHIIEILVNEKMLDRKCTALINEMIHKENHLIISAFEIFSVTKDHWDFCETLNLVNDIYNNNALRNGENTEGLLNSASAFETFLKKNNFNEKEKNKLKIFYEERDDFLLSALEFYESTKDKDELMDNLRILLK